MSDLSRRDFLKKSGIALAGMMIAPTVVPPTVLGKSAGHTAPSDRLNILGVGIGGRGAADLAEMETENIIGLCDCDWRYAKPIFEKYPKAKRYSDYRRMYDDMLKDADAVMVATADHTHAIIAAEAIVAGKHVYVEKPLTLYPYESRLLARLAKKYNVATQMGNQSTSNANTRKALNWLRNGEIGEVTRIEACTNRPIWPQGMATPKEVMKVPKTLDWEAFIGPAKFRPYHETYTPWNFRGWWDFGSGALGDMANHILHVPFRGLELGYPSAVIGSSTMLMSDACPTAEKITFKFPRRDNLPRLALPPVELTWYDGGLTPDLPDDMPQGKKFDINAAAVLYGTKDTLVIGNSGFDPVLCSGRDPEVPQLYRVVENDNHQQDWIRACKESPESRVACESDFSIAGPLNEMITMGVAAVRLQSLNQWLEWDGENMCFTNIPEDATIANVIEDRFRIRDGHPTFDRTFTEPVNAREYAEHLIKPVYRDGWKLPDMPQV